MTVFVHQNKFFSKEYFGSSFKIILVVFYVLNFWDTDFLRCVTVQNDFSVAVAWWAGRVTWCNSSYQRLFHFFKKKQKKKHFGSLFFFFLLL